MNDFHKKHSSLFTFHFSLFVAVLTAMLLSACGYHNPYQKDGVGTAVKSVYLDVWPNRTNELDLETKIFQTLMYWFKKSRNIHITHNQETADYILAGEIRAIDLPVLTYGQYDRAIEIKVILTVSYQIRERQTNAILREENDLIFEEAARTGSNAVTGRDNKKKALALIIEDLAELIYIETLDAIFPL